MRRAEIQVVTVPVSDDDRAKAFYAGKLGWHVDHDHVVHAGLRFIQITPPGVGPFRDVRGPGRQRLDPAGAPATRLSDPS